MWDWIWVDVALFLGRTWMVLALTIVLSAVVLGSRGRPDPYVLDEETVDRLLDERDR